MADSSLRKDQELKAGLYASAGVPECWLVDLVGRVVQLYRVPAGSRYADIATLSAGAVLRPVAFPDVAIDVGDLVRER